MPSAGRDRGLLQESPIASSAGAPGTMAIIKGPKSCPHGQVAIDFFAACPTGTVGTVFR